MLNKNGLREEGERLMKHEAAIIIMKKCSRDVSVFQKSCQHLSAPPAFYQMTRGHKNEQLSFPSIFSQKKKMIFDLNRKFFHQMTLKSLHAGLKNRSLLHNNEIKSIKMTLCCQLKRVEIGVNAAPSSSSSFEMIMVLWTRFKAIKSSSAFNEMLDKRTNSTVMWRFHFNGRLNFAFVGEIFLSTVEKPRYSSL